MQQQHHTSRSSFARLCPVFVLRLRGCDRGGNTLQSCSRAPMLETMIEPPGFVSRCRFRLRRMGDISKGFQGKAGICTYWHAFSQVEYAHREDPLLQPRKTSVELVPAVSPPLNHHDTQSPTSSSLPYLPITPVPPIISHVRRFVLRPQEKATHNPGRTLQPQMRQQ
jgi:hypothetical protein